MARSIFRTGILWLFLCLGLQPAHAFCGFAGGDACESPPSVDRKWGIWGSLYQLLAPKIRWCQPPNILDPASNKCNGPPVITGSLDAVMKLGCMSGSESNDLFKAGQKFLPAGSIAQRALDTFLGEGSRDAWMTKNVVTDPDSWMYRGTDLSRDEAAYESGRLLSFSDRELMKRNWKNRPADFWDSNGPQVTAASSKDLIQTLQAMATKSSAVPASQFSSVALSFEVAEIYGSTIYKFQANPASPVLGLMGCAMVGAEVQYQVPGGTPIKNLHRHIAENGFWEKYDFASKTWSRVEDFKDELKRSAPAAIQAFKSIGAYFSNSAFISDDAHSPNRGTLDMCAQKCLANSQCHFFTYGWADAGPAGQFCTLFSANDFQKTESPEQNYSLYERLN